MASMVELRVEVGLSDLGNVFIFHTAEQDGYTGKPINDKWVVTAGNHDIVTTNDQARAEAVARAICGDDRLLSVFNTETVAETVADAPVEVAVAVEEPEYVAPTRAAVSKTKGK